MIVQERLFTTLADPVDGIMCLPADSDAKAIERLAPSGLRFPLLLDRTTPLRKQVLSSPFAYASSRYGPYCDNITGMNWELPDGRRIRVGERVVKSTTGYDLFRFLVGTTGRYGRAIDYVLRLRPACDTEMSFHLHGRIESLRSVVSFLLQSSWIHWLDQVDYLIEFGSPPFLRIGVHCPEYELYAYQNFVSDLAVRFSASFQAQPGIFLAGTPDLVVKTSPETTIDLALELSKRPQTRCAAICYSGVLHLFLPDEENMTAAIDQIVDPIESTINRIGGHWHSRHISDRAYAHAETGWIATLCKEWGIV